MISPLSFVSHLSSLLLLLLIRQEVDASAVSTLQQTLESQGQQMAGNSISATTAALQDMGVYASISQPTFQSSTDPGSSCQVSSQMETANNFLSSGLRSLGGQLIGPLGRIVTTASSSEEVAQQISYYFPSQFATALGEADTVSGFEGGMGGGFGFEIYCNGQLLVTLGGGGGGGISVQGGYTYTGGVGGGGGAQTNGNRYSVGGGVGCPVSQSGVAGCNPQGDGGGTSWTDLMHAIQDQLNQCREGGSMVVCGGGGGGAGFSFSGCQYGGGFGFGFSGAVSLSQGTNSSVAEAAALKAANVVCPSDRYDQITSGAASECNAACAGKPGYYNSCYCPCFKGKIESAGLSWGYTMTCSV